MGEVNAMTSSPADPLSVLATTAVAQIEEATTSSDLVETPVRENAIKPEDQPSSSRPSRQAKAKAIGLMQTHVAHDTVGENEMRNLRRSTPKHTYLGRKMAPRKRKSATLTSKSHEVAASSPNVREKLSQAIPDWAKEPPSKRPKEAESAGLRLKMENKVDSPACLHGVAALESDSTEAQVPVMDDHQQQKGTSESALDPAVVSVSPEVPVSFMDDQQQDERSESPKNVVIESCSPEAQVPAAKNHQQDERSESPVDAAFKPWYAAFKSCSPDAQVNTVDGQLQDENPESTQDTAAELYSPDDHVPAVDGHGQVKSLESPQDAESCSPEAQMTVVNGGHVKPTESPVPDTGLYQSKKKMSQESAVEVSEVSPPTDQYYVEETAWRNFNPPLPIEGEDIPGAVASEHLQPLPPAPPIPDLPKTGKCRWSFNEDSRVLLADFVQDNGTVQLIYEDEEFLLKMMERDDISVVSYGLATGLNPELWTLKYIADHVGDEYYHKFRAFKQEVVNPEEQKRTSSTAATKCSGNWMGENVSTGPTEEGPAERPPNSGQYGATSELPQANGSKNIAEDLSERFYTVKYREMDQCLSMKIADFVRYVGMRRAALRRMLDGQSLSVVAETDSPGEEEAMFKFLDHMSVEQSVDVTKVVLYMIDFDLVKLLPKLYEDLLNNFELRGCLPGGIHCMMNAVNINGRPFMGPNLYCTPPESFTQCHQDGHGTVDSGHLCLSGFNEVVMLRRLPERHKIHALALLKGKENVGLPYDGLYDLPHGDFLGEKPDWPDLDAIEACRRMNYYPSTFILRPGQLVHINKGRLHAFRKLAPSPLPITDCHATMRSQLLATSNVKNPDGFFCFSVAWDWMYRGITCDGIYREVLATLECAILNRLHNRQSLAIPELSLLQLARTLTPAEDSESMNYLSLLGFPFGKSKISDGRVMPSTEEVLRGILPALRFVVNQHAAAVGRAVPKRGRTERVSLSKRPNSHENPQLFALDPYGNSDFFCKLCWKELSNVYMHCDGCEILLTKDFNICVECWESQKYKAMIQMHPLNKKRHSTINHTGNMAYSRNSRCPCKNGPVCLHCNFCAGCSCKCHQWFTLHRRFFTVEDERSLVRRVEVIVGESQISYSDEVAPRLEAAARSIASSPHDQGSTTASISSTKQSASEDHSESDASKKCEEVEANSGAQKAPIETRRSNRMRENAFPHVPPEAVKAKATRKRANVEPAPSQVPSEAVKVKAEGKRASRNPADSNSGLESFDINQRPHELRAVVSSPIAPVSRDDLSDGALAFTEPRGLFPSLDRGSWIVGFRDQDANEKLHDFMKKARALDVRTPRAIRKILPETCELTEDQVLHLFRNFADCGNIRVIRDGVYVRIILSRRELDILLYGYWKHLTMPQCCALMPYRSAIYLEGMLKNGHVWSAAYPYRASYLQHLENTVGLLLSMEEGNSAQDESLGHVRIDELDVTEDSAERLEDQRTRNGEESSRQSEDRVDPDVSNGQVTVIHSLSASIDPACCEESRLVSADASDTRYDI